MEQQETFEITPLGAATVEAMPDRKRVKAIERAFTQEGKCPTSAIFDAQAVEEFYRVRKLKITAVSESMRR